jgi:hypothetical protein
MPNHIHLLWYIHQQNGKESAAGSIAKFTAHRFKPYLLQTKQLHLFKSNKDDRAFQFWLVSTQLILLLLFLTAQVSDTTGDAIKYCNRKTNNFLSLQILCTNFRTTLFKAFN